MHIALVMVMSADGKTTQWDDPSTATWTSVADFEHFQSLKSSFSAIIMGRITYEILRDKLKRSPGIRRIILTRTPSHFKDDAVPGLFEFTDEPPATLFARLRTEGVGAVLVAGGSHTNKSFLAADLIDELILTIEPVLFGSGLPLVAPIRLRKNLKLTSVDRLNEQGTMVVRYTVNHEHPSTQNA